MLGDGESAFERDESRKRIQHRQGGFSNREAEDAFRVRQQTIGKRSPHRRAWLDGIQRGGQNTQNTRILKTVGSETKSVHFGYHSRNIYEVHTV